MTGVQTCALPICVYPAAVANTAILEIALNADPFPDLGKVVAKCQLKMAERSTQVSQADPSKLSRKVLQQIAAALEIEINE